MAILPTDRRHERAVARLTDALRKPGIEALLKSWLSVIDDLEDELAGLAVGMTSIEDAVGAQLQVLARVVGSQEVGDDDLQRLLVRTRILVVRSSGTGDDLLRILQLVTATPELTEYFPATILAGTLHESDAITAALVFSFLNAARSAGIRIGLLWTTGLEPDVFAMADADPLDALSPVAVVEDALGWEPDYLWGGALTDEVSGELLTAGGSVSLEDARIPTDRRFGAETVYDVQVGDDNAFTAVDTSIGDLTDATSIAIFVAVDLRDAQPTAVNQVIIGKQLTSGEFPGWQLFSRDGSNLPRFQVDPDPGAATALNLTAASYENAGGVRVFGLLVDRSTGGSGTMYFASDAEASVSASAPTGATTTAPLKLGDSRPSNSIPAANQQTHVLVIKSGVSVEGMGPTLQAHCQALLARLTGTAQTDAARGFADDAQTQGGQLLDIVAP